MKRAGLPLAVSVLIGWHFGSAAPAAEQAGAKETDSYEAMRAATLQVWNAGPLLFRKVFFVTESPTGFGIYKPRPDSVFKPGEKLIIYAEPVGFKWERKIIRNDGVLTPDISSHAFSLSPAAPARMQWLSARCDSQSNDRARPEADAALRHST